MSKKLIISIILTPIFAIGIIAYGIYNFMPVAMIQSLTGSPEMTLGSTLTTINGSDTLSSSRSVINANFASLNTGKIEVSTTSMPLLTTASTLSTIGTIISGIWHGTLLDVLYGGTGRASLTSNAILLGNGTSGINTTTAGTDGQLLTYSSSSLPYWSSPSVDGSVNYTWSGTNSWSSISTFTGPVSFSNTASFTGTTTSSHTPTNGNDVVNKTYNDLYSANYDFKLFSTNATGTVTVAHNLGVVPRMIRVITAVQESANPSTMNNCTATSTSGFNNVWTSVTNSTQYSGYRQDYCFWGASTDGATVLASAVITSITSTSTILTVSNSSGTFTAYGTVEFYK